MAMTYQRTGVHRGGEGDGVFAETKGGHALIQKPDTINGGCVFKIIP